MGLPDFLIIGAARCGTSSLFSNLLKHPRIRGPHLPLTRLSNHKECHFFDRKIRSNKFTIKWYKDRFKDPGSDIVFFEATPNYIFGPEVPRFVKIHLPMAKFILMLRNPADRAWSHFYHWQNKNHHPVDILKNRSSEYIKKGIYWEQLERWFKFFPREQFFIIRSEDFFKDPKSFVMECFKFVGIEPVDFKKKSIVYWDPKREYLVSRRSYPGAPYPILRFLRNYFASHNERLEKLLNRKFEWD